MDRTGEQLRDAGIALVDSNNYDWKEAARKLLPILLWRGQLVTGEDIKLRLRAAGMPEPKSPSAWSSLIAYAVNHNYLVDSGKSKRCSLPSAHSRRTAIWRVS